VATETSPPGTPPESAQTGEPDGLERLWTPHRMAYVTGSETGDLVSIDLASGAVTRIASGLNTPNALIGRWRSN